MTNIRKEFAKKHENFASEFGERIRHVHISGFEKYHEPICKTQQQVILNAIPSKALPITIESVLKNIDEAKREYAHIENHLEN